MAVKDALVVYKNKPALVKEYSEGKILISLEDGGSVKVREKDIELIYPGPVKDFSFAKNSVVEEEAVQEAWELLLSENEPVSLKALCELLGAYNASFAWKAYCLLKENFYFTGTIDAIKARSKEEAEADLLKRDGKEREVSERASFIERLKLCLKNPEKNPMHAEDVRYLQDVEALTFEKTQKSRTMKEAGLGETPEDAHSLLLKTGFWTEKINPHPVRTGVLLNSAVLMPQKPPVTEERRDLTNLPAFAIDNPWSNDPDDAVSIEIDSEGRTVLYVHISDPASSILPGSPEDKEARGRGVTLYLPEGTYRMLNEDSLPLFALGLSEVSPALTFKMTLYENCEILQTEIFPSFVRVRCMTYTEADREMESSDTAEALRALFELSQRSYEMRIKNGAVNIELPEVHIKAENGEVSIEPVLKTKSASMVRECMLIAGAGAGLWAAQRGVSIPYILQEVEEQGKIPSGLAGSYLLRKCMRTRIIQTKPGRHQGLGIDSYTQVTSPLRRYTDLLVHMQIRAFLHGEKTLTSDEVLERVSLGEAAALAATQAERLSRTHWTLVWLQDKKESVFEATTLEKKGNRAHLIIPSLAFETQVHFNSDLSPNENVKLALKSVNIPRLEAIFTPSTRV